MARKPVSLINVAGKHDPRQALWDTMRQLGEFTVLDLEDRTRVDLSTIRSYITGLTRAGYLEPIAGESRPHVILGRHERKRWRLANDIGVEAPRVTKQGKHVVQGRAREQMWRTMRVLDGFDFHSLALHASTEDCAITEQTAKDYIKHLYKAGYLQCTRPGVGPKSARYRLIASRYTGPRPPMIQRIKQVFDPNLGKVVWPKGGRS